MNKMKVHVTKSDITKSDNKRYIGGNYYLYALDCPVACAIQRTHKFKYGNIIVGKNAISLFSSKGKINFSLSKAAKKFIRNYDKKLQVKPFSFTANLLTL